MQNFEPYVAELEACAAAALRDGLAEEADARDHLDGAAGRALRAAVPLKWLRAAGAFFTGERLAADVLALVGHRECTFTDPACGCGDLLLAAAWRLPVEATAVHTLARWGELLVGRDLEPAFARATRARLALLALVRGAAPSAEAAPPLIELLPEVRVGDGLEAPLPGDVVLLNPPYGYTTSRPDNGWANGRVARAAVFTLDVLERLRDTQDLVVVLPDVLRSGTRYASWRRRVATLANIRDIVPAGPFDALTNVDVFVVSLSRTQNPTTAWPAVRLPQDDASLVVGDQFDVSVGAVVAYRAPNRGPWHRFLDARGAGEPGSDVIPARNRRFHGTTHTPPFVVVRRTSAPSRGGPRLRSSLVLGDRPVAVENHLLVATPHSGSEDLCRRLVTHLQSRATTTWLDHRIRCRHLTVASLRELPWPDAARDHQTPALCAPDPRSPRRRTQPAP